MNVVIRQRIYHNPCASPDANAEGQHTKLCRPRTQSIVSCTRTDVVLPNGVCDTDPNSQSLTLTMSTTQILSTTLILKTDLILEQDLIHGLATISCIHMFHPYVST